LTGELPDRGISRSAIDNLLQFNLALGVDYQGDWMTCDSLRITILNTTYSPPPALGILTVTVLPSGKLRNWPPASNASSHAFNGTLGGSFGPEAISIVALVAQDGGSGKGTYDINDTVTLVLSEPTDRGGLAEYLTYAQVNSVVSFNMNLGSNYSARWLESGVWVSPMGPGIVPDVPHSRILKITVHNTSGASPPTIDTLRATFLPSARIRNVPPVCTPASSTSPTLTADFGPTQIDIVGISARGDVDCAGSVCDSVYGNGDVIDIQFSEDITMCMQNCSCSNASDHSSTCVRPLDVSVAQHDVDSSFVWSHLLGAQYRAAWLNRQVLRIFILNSTGATPPELYALSVHVTAAAGIRNYPPTGRLSVPTSNTLCQTKRNLFNLDCAFGKADILINRIVATASTRRENPETLGKISVDDRLTIVMNQATSLGRPMLCNGGQVSKAQTGRAIDRHEETDSERRRDRKRERQRERGCVRVRE